MKRLFYLLLGIILVFSFRVNALGCDITYNTMQNSVVSPTPITEQNDEYEATVMPSSDDPNVLEKSNYDRDVANNEILPKEKEKKVNTKWLTMAVVLSVLIVILIISMIIINKRGKNE
jgi:hypothetical protein